MYTPYGEVTVHQETGYGDRDGDQDVSLTRRRPRRRRAALRHTSKARGVVSRIDFDGDYDATDAGLCDSLPQGFMVNPGRSASRVNQPFAHQGLLFEPEITSYQNRLRHYAPTRARFLQRDPLIEGPDGLIWHRWIHGGKVVVAEINLWADFEIDAFVPDRLNSHLYQSNAPLTMLDPSGGCRPPDPFPKPLGPYYKPVGPRRMYSDCDVDSGYCTCSDGWCRPLAARGKTRLA